MKRLFFFVLISCMIVQSNAQSKWSALASAFARFEDDEAIKFGIASLTVLNAETGEILFSKNAEKGLAPASTLKTLTSIVALNTLGEDYTWETKLAYVGRIEHGVLHGDVIVIGGGDPSLGSDRYVQSSASALLTRWIGVIKRAGIQKIEGRVIGDDSLFGSDITPQGWIWQDMGNYYGGGASSLSWKENMFGVNLIPGSGEGDAVQILRMEEVPNLKTVNEVKTGRVGSGDNVYGYGAPFSDVLYLRGTYATDLKKTVKFANPDPAFQLAWDLRNKLNATGCTVTGDATTSRRLSIAGNALVKGVRTVIDVYQSPSLAKVVYWLNQKSINLYAENILRTLALRQRKDPGFIEGVEVLKQFVAGMLKMDPDAISILDGSGLSPENRITTMVMAKALSFAYNQPWFDVFYESLPLYNDMKMKSGSIRNVLCYAGVQKKKGSASLVFSIITNNYNTSTRNIKQKLFAVLDGLK